MTCVHVPDFKGTGPIKLPPGVSFFKMAGSFGGGMVIMFVCVWGVCLCIGGTFYHKVLG